MNSDDNTKDNVMFLKFIEMAERSEERAESRHRRGWLMDIALILVLVILFGMMFYFMLSLFPALTSVPAPPVTNSTIG